TAVAVADRQVSMPKQGRGGVRGLSASQKGGRGRQQRPEAGSNRTRGESAGDLDPMRTVVFGPTRSFLRAMGSRSTKVSNRTFVAGPPTAPRCNGMALDDERQDTRRGVLKNLAAAGLGAAIGTVAARQFPPWPSEPGVGVPEIAGPGTLDAVFNVRDQGAVGDGAADDTGALIRTIGRVPAS